MHRLGGITPISNKGLTDYGTLEERLEDKKALEYFN